MSPVKATLALCAVLAFGAMDAQAGETQLNRMVHSGRACLGHLGALRQTKIFRQHDFATLMRRMAHDIDMAEAWRARDLHQAMVHARKASDCEAGVANWLKSRATAATATAVPVNAILPDTTAHTGFNPDDQRYVAELMSGRPARRSPAGGGQANWGNQFR